MASVYTAVVLTEDSRVQLIELVASLDYAELLKFDPATWATKAHHMTIATKSAEKAGVADLVGREFTLEVKRFGSLFIDDNRGVFAVEVETEAPSKNAIKHVTVAVAEGVKPVMSNEITNWRDVSYNLVLRGVVKEVEVVRA